MRGNDNAGVGGWMRCGCGECRGYGWYTWFRYCVLAQLTCYGGAYEMCMCLARGGVGGERIRRLGLG